MPSNAATGGISGQERHDVEFLRPRSAAHTDMDTGERQPVTPGDKQEGAASGEQDESAGRKGGIRLHIIVGRMSDGPVRGVGVIGVHKYTDICGHDILVESAGSETGARGAQSQDVVPRHHRLVSSFKLQRPHLAHNRRDRGRTMCSSIHYSSTGQAKAGGSRAGRRQRSQGWRILELR
jgi:hypothetical protein